VPGRSLGGVELGWTRAQVAAAWGHAYGRCRSCSHETLYFNRQAFHPEGAGVTMRGGRVTAVFTLWAPAFWHTSHGLAIGEPLSRLRATYRAARRRPCGSFDAFELPGRGHRTVVYVADAAVWGFALLAAGEPVCR
jgi:hypothetical protein